MATCDTGSGSPAGESGAGQVGEPGAQLRPWYRKTWPHAGGLLIGSVAVVIATAITTGTELAGSPSASAFNTPTPTTPTATVSGVADQTKADRYWAKLQPAYSDTISAVQKAGTAMQADDVDGAKNACQQMNSGAQEIKATLPSPNSEVTPRIQSAADAIITAANICMGFGPDTTPADVDAFWSHISDATASVKSAQRIMPG